MWFLEKYSPVVKFANFQRIVERAKKVDVSDDYIDPNHLTLVYKSVPTWVSSEIILFETKGKAAYFSDPLRMSEFQRICWVKFEKLEDYQRALEE
jgi:hypothetical protein